MKKIGILLDSFGGISEKEIKANGFEMIPLQFSIDGKDYIDNGSELSNKEISELVKTSEETKTSLPSLATIEERLEQMSKEYENVIVLLTSSALSSTFQTVMVESKKYGDKFKLVDNHFFADQALEISKFLVKKAAEGKTIDELIKFVKQVNEKSLNYLIVKDLTSLIRGGRLTGMKKILLNSFKLIPLLKVSQEGISFGGLKRTLKGSYEKVIEKLIEFIGGLSYLENYEFKFSYAGDLEMFNEAQKALNEYKAKIEKDQISSATVLIHTGFKCASIGIWPKLSKLKF
ncbi:DegV family protein [Mesomycoplasma lagogenitalium]|uniref:DegV family protein n=1 Tax=Mesomycoplasma lagogenitalium TaxID=171286 RepID=A0ABY8LUQ2_9BACT|nr:DegV family protein [Mesomycoplasma lagogenitalium]WGI36965.1 DegV family protein [Mesomycoplasma lagogenitalium]